MMHAEHKRCHGHQEKDDESIDGELQMEGAADGRGLSARKSTATVHTEVKVGLP